MSYDLYFCWRRNRLIDVDLVEAWAKGLEKFQRNGDQLWYQNSLTGVYFSLDLDSTDMDDPESGLVLPEGYFNTGLTFNLNFNRPSYFAHEAMPIVDALNTNFELSVLNPQAAEGEEFRAMWDPKTLIQSWEESNRRAVQALIKDPEFARPLRLAYDKSLFTWRYRLAMQQLESLCGDEVLVPQLVVVRRLDALDLGTAFVYSEGVPTIVPDSDWVFVVGNRRSIFHSKDEVWALSSPTFRELAKPFLERVEWEGPILHVIKPESVDGLDKMLSRCESRVARKEFDVVAPDSFVDAELD
jgi:hypothetical protein